MKKKGKRGKKKENRLTLILLLVAGIGLVSGGLLVWGLGGGGEEPYLVPPGGEGRPILSPALFVGRTARAYEAAKKYPELMDKVWCYCGCVRNSGHRSLKTCFINKHASYCDVCMLEALEAKKLYEEGYTVAQIRKTIHRMFGRR